MKHGFGMSMADIAATDIATIANNQGYTALRTGTSVSVSDITGEHLIVDVIDGVYIIKADGKEVTRKSVNGAMKYINATFKTTKRKLRAYYD
ncbi:hypothetical protein [Peribacillus simplex]|uniref:hypothetical protein n=1 Tax=Peribacillus simplex TaxID=1478 RepID=UPI003D2E456E